MPIVVQHQPSPAAVGLAAYTAGLGQASEKKRKEQQALLQQMYDKRFQYGMNQLRYGQEQQLQQERWQQQKQWQDARDEREFGQKQQLANAEARARGEPLPFPDFGQGSQGPMQGRLLPGGRQVFEGPDTTVDPSLHTTSGGGSYRDDFLRLPGTPGGATGGVGGTAEGPMTPYQRQLKLQQEREAAAAQAAADRATREGIAKGTHEVPPSIQKRIDDNAAAIEKLETDDKMTEEDKAKLRPGLLAKQRELDALGVRMARQKPQQAPQEFPLQGGGSVIRQPNGTWLHVKPDTSGQMTPAQKAQAEEKAKEREAKRQTERAKYQSKQEKDWKNAEPVVRERIAAEVAKEHEQPRRGFGAKTRPITAAEAEADPDIAAKIDARVEAERKARVDDAVEKAYPTPKQEPPPTAPTPPQTAPPQPPAAAPPETYNNPNDPTPWLPDWAKPSAAQAPAEPPGWEPGGVESKLAVPIWESSPEIDSSKFQKPSGVQYGPQQPGPNGQQPPAPASPSAQSESRGPTPPDRLNRERYRVKLELEYAAAEEGLRQQIAEKAGPEASKAEIDRLIEEERRKRVDVPLEMFDNWEKSQGAATAQSPAPAQQPTVPAGMTRLIEAARAGNRKAQQALEQRGVQWQQ